MDNDRNEFYKQLQYCKSRKEIEDLFETIENIELYEVIEDKYNQIIELNKDEDLKNIIKILEYTYLNFENNKKDK